MADPFNLLHNTIIRRGSTTDRPTVPPDLSAIFLDQTPSLPVLYGTNGSMEWVALGGGNVTSHDVTMDVLGTPAYTTLQDWSDVTVSAGLISGGAITNAGGGACAVAAGIGIVKGTDSDVGNNVFFAFGADASVTLTNESANWVYVEPGATPEVDATPDWTTLDLHTQVILGMVWREDTELHIVPVAQLVTDMQRRVMQRLWEKEHITRVEGLSLSDKGTLHFAISKGALYAALSRLTTLDFDSSGAGRFTYIYKDGGGGWTEVATQSQIDNGYWDDGTGALNTLTSNQYGNHWVYSAHDGEVYVQYGQGDYTLAQAQAALVPDSPPELTNIATLVGKIIVQQGAANLYSVVSAFKQTFQGTTVTDHGALTGLSDDDHSQYLLVNGSRAMSGDLELDSNELIATEQGSPPSTPASNKRKLYPKANGWYDLDDAGQESGPLGSGALPFNFRQGLAISRMTDAQVYVESGAVTVESALVEKKISTVLNLITAGDWIGGSSLEAASSWVNVYVDASGNILLHDTLPNYPVADTASRVATARVNQGTWDGTSTKGLDATSLIYDGDTGEDNIAAGMYLGVYTDAAYTTGRGKGSAALGSKNSLSFALITEVNTGTNTLTLAAGHQIAIQDNDYLFVIEAGAPIFNNISSTWYRWLGALWNDASSNLISNDNKSAFYTVTGVADYTTSSTTFTPIDATLGTLSLPLVTMGGDISAFFAALMTWTTTINYMKLNYSIDGANVVGDDGIVGMRASNYDVPPIHWNQRVLPGSHLVTVLWKVSGTGMLLYVTGTNTTYHPQFIVREV